MGDSENMALPLTTRYTAKVLAGYEADLREVLELYESGKPLPSKQDLRRFFKKEHGVTVSEGTLKRHMSIIQEGGKIWPGK